MASLDTSSFTSAEKIKKDLDELERKMQDLHRMHSSSNDSNDDQPPIQQVITTTTTTATPPPTTTTTRTSTPSSKTRMSSSVSTPRSSIPRLSKLSPPTSSSRRSKAAASSSNGSASSSSERSRRHAKKKTTTSASSLVSPTPSRSSPRIRNIDPNYPWQPLPNDLLHPRQSHTSLVMHATEKSQLILTLGGWDKRKVLSGMEVLHLPSHKQTESSRSMHTPRYEFGAAVDDNHVLLVVGGGRDKRKKLLDSMEVYHSGHQQWTALVDTKLSSPKCGVALVILDGRLYVLGGMDGSSKSCNTMQVMDLQTKQWISRHESGHAFADMQEGRAWFGAVVANKEIHVFGGLDCDTQEDLNSVEIYNPHHNTWRYGCPMPTPRSHCTAATVHTTEGKAQLDLAVVVGGSFEGEFLRTVEAYHDDSWTRLPDLHFRRAGCGAFGIGKDLYVAGGAAGKFNVLDSMEKLARVQKHLADGVEYYLHDVVAMATADSDEGSDDEDSNEFHNAEEGDEPLVVDDVPAKFKTDPLQILDGCESTDDGFYSADEDQEDDYRKVEQKVKNIPLVPSASIEEQLHVDGEEEEEEDEASELNNSLLDMRTPSKEKPTDSATGSKYKDLLAAHALNNNNNKQEAKDIPLATSLSVSSSVSPESKKGGGPDETETAVTTMVAETSTAEPKVMDPKEEETPPTLEKAEEEEEEEAPKVATPEASPAVVPVPVPTPVEAPPPAETPTKEPTSPVQPPPSDSKPEEAPSAPASIVERSPPAISPLAQELDAKLAAAESAEFREENKIERQTIEKVQMVEDTMIETEKTATKVFVYEIRLQQVGAILLNRWEAELRACLTFPLLSSEEQAERRRILRNESQGDFYLFLILKLRSMMFACESLVGDATSAANDVRNLHDHAVNVLRHGVSGTIRDIDDTKLLDAIEKVSVLEMNSRAASSIRALGSLLKNTGDNKKAVARIVYFGAMSKVLERTGGVQLVIERTARLIVRARSVPRHSTLYKKLQRLGRFEVLVLGFHDNVPQREGAQLAATLISRTLMHPKKRSRLYKMMKSKGELPQVSLQKLLTCATLGLTQDEVNRLPPL